MLKSILAGICISIGCISYLSVDNKYLGAFLFSLGLLTVITFQLNLFTGKVGYLCTVNHKLRYLGTLFSIWVGNLTGCSLIALLDNYTRLNIDTSTLISVKENDTYLSLFILAIFCGMLMHIAVVGYKKIQNPLIVVLPVMVFILIGAEHCVADMFYWLEIRRPFTIIPLLVITLGNAVGGNVIEYIMTKNEKTIFDMNKFDSIIEEDLDNFDFEETAAIMQDLNHEWYGEGIPTVLQIKKEVRKRLINDYKRLIELKEEFVYSSSGGIRIECHYNEEYGYWADIIYCPVETLR